MSKKGKSKVYIEDNDKNMLGEMSDIKNNNKKIITKIESIKNRTWKLANIGDYEGSQEAGRIYRQLLKLKHDVNEVFVCPFKCCVICLEKGSEEL